MNNKTNFIGQGAWLQLFFATIVSILASVNSYSFTVMDEIVITDDRFSERLAMGVLYLEDKERNLISQDVIKGKHDQEFTRFPKNTLQMGYNENPIWIKLTVTNNLFTHTTDSLSDRFYVSVRYPLLDSVEFFHVTSDHVQELHEGDQFAFDQRYFDLNNFVFPISLYRGETSDIYIRVQSTSSVSIPLYLETERAFTETQHSNHAINGIYIGITLGLLIYNCFLWLGVRKPVYGFYALAILSIFAFNATITGYTYRLWPEAIAFQQIAVYVLSTFAAVTTCAFGLVFLDARRSQPKMFWFMLAAIAVYSGILVSMFFIPSILSAKLNVLVTVSGILILLIMAVRAIMQGKKSASFYLIGQGAVLFSVFFTVLTSQGVVPLYYMAPEVLKWCSAFELIFFSFALANLVNEERHLRELAQKESAMAQEQALRAQIELNENLDKLVHDRTTELEHANQMLKELNTKDELTGLRNRRYLNELLPKEYKRAYRDRKEISVLMMDIDFFKQINDNHGHQVGDACLTLAGQIISDNLHRPTDFAVRYGGEEFVVVLGDTPLAGAVAVAEKIRQHFEHTPVPINDNESIQITISVGVDSEVPTERADHESLLRRADDYLYRAKEEGRNQVQHPPTNQVPFNKKKGA